MAYVNLLQDDKEVAGLVKRETQRQQDTLSLVASEHYAPRSVLEVLGSAFANRTAEGYPRNRYYAGCEHIDAIEELAISRARQLFGADHANVQTHSGTGANLAAYQAVLETGDTVLAMELTAGGHLSHGHPMNISGQIYQFIAYGVNSETELIDYDQLTELARKYKPRLIVGGASSYSRLIDWPRLRSVADEVSAFLLADIAHTSGLMAAKVIPSAVPHAHLVTSSCHKTLNGPRGGLILCKKDLAARVDKAVFPGQQSAVIWNTIAAKAVCLKRAMSPEFVEMQKQTVRNAKALADALKHEGLRIVSGGTDNHLMLVDLRKQQIKGSEAECALEEIGILVNRNFVPYDREPSQKTSGIRIGMSAVTKRGMREEQMCKLASIMGNLLNNIHRPSIRPTLRDAVSLLSRDFPIP